MFIHVFGCPCQYEPAHDVLHKRAAKTEWGWFVGVQWPMVLILRPEDHKIFSISRKKVYCHEMMYAKFDAETQTRPRIDFKDFTLDTDEVDAAIQKARELGKRNRQSDATTNAGTDIPVDIIPSHVLSVKALSDSKRNQHLLTPEDRVIPSDMIKTYHEAEGSGECSKFDIPETLKFRGEKVKKAILSRNR